VSLLFSSLPLRHLSYVEVENLTTRDRAVFVAERWLDKKTGTQCELLPSTAGDPALQKHQYKVSVRTSDVRGAGTDKDISIVLIGADGSKKTKEIRLDSSADNFERNRTDEFLLTLPADEAVGEVAAVEVGFMTQQSVGGKLGFMGMNW
jgi:lipoxygenase homology domain-containing protein 1